MEEHEKMPRRLYTEEEWRKAFESWKAWRASDMDFNELETPLTKEIWDVLHRKYKTQEEN